MHWLLIVILSLTSFATHAQLGEQCSTDIDPNVKELIHQENAPGCFIESLSGSQTVGPFTYKTLTKAEMRNPKRNATIDDFVAGEMVHFVNEEGQHGYYWPYEEVFKTDNNNYYFHQSGNENYRTELTISKVGPFKKLAIVGHNYSVSLICSDQSYINNCVSSASVNTSGRSEIKDVDSSAPANSNSLPANGSRQ